MKDKYRIQDEKDDMERKLHALQRRLADTEEAVRNLKGSVELQQTSLQERDQRINQMRRELRESERRATLDTTAIMAPSERSLSPFSNFAMRRNTSPYPESHLQTPIAGEVHDSVQ